MRPAIVLLAILVSRPAAAERCVDWAIPGALAGLVAADAITFGAFQLAGDDPNAPTHATRDGWLIGGGLALGATLGPIASCRGRDGEVPAASFVIAGALLGGGGAFGGSLWLLRDRPALESTMLIGAMAMTAGGAAGAWLGYKLHARWFPTVDATPDFKGVAIAGRF